MGSQHLPSFAHLPSLHATEPSKEFQELLPPGLTIDLDLYNLLERHKDALIDSDATPNFVFVWGGGNVVVYEARDRAYLSNASYNVRIFWTGLGFWWDARSWRWTNSDAFLETYIRWMQQKYIVRDTLVGAQMIQIFLMSILRNRKDTLLTSPGPSVNR